MRALHVNTYIIGRSGSGKSTLLHSLILDDNSGWTLLDPHGDLALAIADTAACVYWDASSNIGFNPLADISKGQRHLVAQQVVSSFKAIWDESWGPRLEWILYNASLLCADNNLSLLDLPTVLTDKAFRTQCLRRSTYRPFWENEFAKWDDRYRNDAIAPVLNKVGQLCADPTLQKILSHNSIDLKRLMDKQHRLVVNLSMAQFGETASALLGSLLVSAFFYEAQTRATQHSFTLYVDEFHRFATESFSTILAEARKRGLFVVLAHQFLDQLPKGLRQGVFGNVKRFISFRVSGEDSPTVAKELGIPFPQETSVLTSLSDFEYLDRKGAQFDRFTTKLPSPTLGRLRGNIRQTRAAYGQESRGV